MILRRERSLFPTVKSPFKWLPWCEGVRGRGGAVCPLSAFASYWWVGLSLLWTAILHILQLLQCGLKPNDFPKKKNPRLSLIDGDFSVIKLHELSSYQGLRLPTMQMATLGLPSLCCMQMCAEGGVLYVQRVCSILLESHDNSLQLDNNFHYHLHPQWPLEVCGFKRLACFLNYQI